MYLLIMLINHDTMEETNSGYIEFVCVLFIFFALFMAVLTTI